MQTRFKYISCSYLSCSRGGFFILIFSFKYISCSYLSNFAKKVWWKHRDSNTSHVLIYHMYLIFYLYRITIQIHLMFLFIFVFKRPFITTINSNTSHVLIYHCTKLHKIIFVKNSNTSHVLIYLYVQISRTMNSFNSNTSHVLIYQQTAVARFTLAVFKYISCSYLSCCRRYSDSTNMVIQIHLMFLFIACR